MHYEHYRAVARNAPFSKPLSFSMNALPKYVVSTTLTNPQWNNTTVVDHDPIETIDHLKQQPGADIVQYGFGPLSHALLAAGLLDELRLWVHPLFVGTGTTADLLYRAGSSGTFDLIDLTHLKSGIVILTYQATTQRRTRPPRDSRAATADAGL
jgi:dihydrofolate reductase